MLTVKIQGQTVTDNSPEDREEFLRKVLDNMPIVIFACDVNGRVTMCEGGGVGSGGLKGIPLLGHPFWEGGEDLNLLRRHFAKALAGRSSTFGASFSDRTFYFHYAPILGDSEAVIGVTVVGLDISMQQVAEDENRQLSAFIASLSHELRTPLSTVIGFAELLAAKKAGPLNAKQEHYVNYIGRGGQQLLNMVNHVLDLSTVKAGRMTIESEPLDAVTATRSALLQVAPMATAKGVELSVDAGEPTIRMVADPQRLHQILLNLLSNAIKFTPAGGLVTIGVAQEDPETTTFAVGDTGCGISADNLDYIFDEYRQVGSGAARSSEGAGLGLALSSQIAGLMGGAVTVQSTVGQGSCFTLHLPSIFLAGPSRREPAKSRGGRGRPALRSRPASG